MSRDHRKLRVFTLADELVIAVYRVTASLLGEERFGLRLQLRRAALSTASNIVEGSARRTTRDYVHFLTVATGSGTEARYLIDVARRLELLPEATCLTLDDRYARLLRGIERLVRSLENRPSVDCLAGSR